MFSNIVNLAFIALSVVASPFGPQQLGPQLGESLKIQRVKRMQHGNIIDTNGTNMKTESPIAQDVSAFLQLARDNGREDGDTPWYEKKDNKFLMKVIGVIILVVIGVVVFFGTTIAIVDFLGDNGHIGTVIAIVVVLFIVGVYIRCIGRAAEIGTNYGHTRYKRNWGKRPVTTEKQ